ncbi:MAG TPA: ATP-dependent endonuclease [Dehalococcoidia bacterium]|nr:ATP-dependent endonuclease [Dehalococcoidia bacterium]
MLTRLQVRNFRCLENIDVPLEPLTAFVGPNGSGKTTFLRAIDLVLGDAWPSLRSFRIPQDFTHFDTNRDIEITVWFDPPYVHRDTLSAEHQVQALRLTCKPYKRSGKWGEAGDLHADLEPLNEDGNVPIVATGQPQQGQRPQYGPLRVGTELRDHARILYVDHRRTLAQHLPSLRGSILGRLLQKARKEFDAAGDFKSKYEAAMETLRTDQVKKIEEIVAETTKRMLGFLGSSAIRDLDIGFGFADPANPFNSLRLEYRESGLTVPGEELGLGIQSAMVVGIFEAFRQLGGEFGTVVIEEPEMYLHPQAQRYFHRLLCEMARNEQCQVIYSTHSPIFADVNRFEALRLVRRVAGKTNVAFVAEREQSALEQARSNFKLGNRFDAARNEILFASKALLTEGYGDRIAALMIANKLQYDLDAEGATVVDCGGKDGIVLFVRVCRALNIPFVVLHDEDIWPTDNIADDEKRKKQEKENEEQKQKNERIRDAVGEDGAVYVTSPSLEAALGISRDSSDKPRKIAEKLEGLNLTEIPPGLGPLIEAVKRLCSDDGS